MIAQPSPEHARLIHRLAVSPKGQKKARQRELMEHVRHELAKPAEALKERWVW